VTPIRATMAMAFVLSCAPAALPCSVVGPLPSPQQLVSRAEIIVRARAEGPSASPGRRDDVLTDTATQVRFSILEVLKGSLAAGTIEFNGTLIERDDPNDRPVPYDFIRPGGRSGNCFALAYREGAQYLLLLRRLEPSNALTPYWAPLSPTNEQLSGGTDDAWLGWVAGRLRSR
jgi:hypothetical protein